MAKIILENGVLGVVLPDMIDKIYKGNYTCDICGKSHRWIDLVILLIIKEFWCNDHLDDKDNAHIRKRIDIVC